MQKVTSTTRTRLSTGLTMTSKKYLASRSPLGKISEALKNSERKWTGTQKFRIKVPKKAVKKVPEISIEKLQKYYIPRFKNLGLESAL